MDKICRAMTGVSGCILVKAVNITAPRKKNGTTRWTHHKGL